MSKINLEGDISMNVPKMSVDTFGKFEQQAGNGVFCIDGFYWRQVRPCFFRPLLSFRPYSKDELGRVPLSSHIGAIQYAVHEGEESNSFFNYWAFENTRDYSVGELGKSQRKSLKKACEVFDVRPIDNPKELNKAHEAYLSFQKRTSYGAMEYRKTEEGFNRWAQSLFDFPSSFILGLYMEGKLSAVGVSRVIEDTMINSTYFASNEALDNHSSDLLMHVRRQIVKGHPEIKRIHLANYMNNGEGLNNYYKTRGATLVQTPTMLEINPLTSWALKRFKRDQFDKLCGIINKE